MLKNSKRSQQLRLLLQLQPPVQSYRVRIGEYEAFGKKQAANGNQTLDLFVQAAVVSIKSVCVCVFVSSLMRVYGYGT